MINYSDEYRKEYIEFISELSRKYDSFNWWCSSVAEKNVIDENTLFKRLNDGYDKTKKYCGLITWIDERNFDENGNFNETYFGKLYDVLLKKDNFILLPNILYTIKEEKAYPLLDKNNIKYLRYKECFNKIDIVKSLFKTLWFQPVKNKIFFNNKDITKLLKSIFLKETENCVFLKYYLTYYSIKRIAKYGIKFDNIIYLFENQPWEKVLCYAVKKFMPETKLIGYMHTMTLPNLVSIFPGEYEKENMPQPDYIFTTGKMIADGLKKYWKPNKINLRKYQCKHNGPFLNVL